MGSRRSFVKDIFLVMSALITMLLSACGAKPDAETEPSPEWPPKED